MKFLLCFLLCFSLCDATTSLPSIHSTRLHTPPLAHINEYHVIKVLGEGDQARVYKAQDTSGKLVAVKVFYTKSEMQQVHPEKVPFIDQFFTDDGSSKAALDEIAIGSTLDHSNIMKLYTHASTVSDLGEKQDFVVLEYIHGTSIDKTSLTKEEAKNVAIQLIEALRHACAKGFIHKDLWSENLFLDEERNLKIIDLGSFEPIQKETRTTFRAYWKAIKHTLRQIGLDSVLIENLDIYTKQQKKILLRSKNQAEIVSHFQKMEEHLRDF